MITKKIVDCEERTNWMPKRRNWVMVINNLGEHIFVKVIYPKAGKNGLHFLARSKKEDEMVLYYRGQLIGILDGKAEEKRLNKKYHEKDAKKKKAKPIKKLAKKQ